MSDSPNSSDWVLLARITRPRGNKGEVAAELFTDFPERITPQRPLFLRKLPSQPKQTQLVKFWTDRNHPGMGVFHFDGFNSINDAETLRGYEVVIPIADRVQLESGKYFVSDLIGCTVFELPQVAHQLASDASEIEEAPRLLGIVQDLFLPGEGVAGTPLLQVQTPSGELLLPLAEDICRRISVQDRRIDVTLPEGLKDLIGN